MPLTPKLQNRIRLDVSKKVHNVSVSQRAKKLQLVKDEVTVFRRIRGHPQSLVSHNFVTIWAK